MLVLCLWYACTIGTSASAASPPIGTVITNRATVTCQDADGNLLPEASATVSTTISGGPELAITKTASSTVVVAGDILTYTITCENKGNTDATTTVVIDNLPAEVVFLNASTGSVYTTDPPGGGIVTWNHGTILPGTSVSFWVTARTKASLAAGTTILNRANITSAEGKSAVTNHSALVGSAPDLTVSKSVTPRTIKPNGIITYSITYKNSGNRAASSVSIGDTIPAGTTYVNGSSTAGGTLTGNLLSWTIGSVAAGAQGSVSFQLLVSSTASDGDIIRNTAALTSAAQGTINSNAVNTQVLSSPSILTVKTGLPDPVRMGDIITYTIQITNEASTNLTGLVITDPLPDHTAFVSADLGGILKGNDIVWSLGTLAGGASATVTLALQVLPFSDLNPVIVNRFSAIANEAPSQTASAVTSVICRTQGSIRFLDASWAPTNRYSVGDPICVEVTDLDQNRNSSVAETVTISIKTSNTEDAETLTLTETGVDTGIFRSCISSNSGPTVQNDGSLTIAPDIKVTVVYEDPLDSLCGYSSESTADILIDPFGIIFDSVTGLPVAGVVVTLIDDATGLAAVLPLNPKTFAVQPNPVVTAADGVFKFEYCNPGTYHLSVVPPSGYGWPSALPNAELRVSWPGYVIDDNGSKGESFTLTAASPPLNLDIPVDPPGGSFSIEKTANKNAASIGDLVQYTVTVSNNGVSPIGSITVHDAMPHGIQYLAGSSHLDGAKIADPLLTAGRTVIWTIPALAPGGLATVTFRALVGPDSHRGTGRNTAWAAGTTVGKPVASNVAYHDLKITEGVFTSKATIIGKVFIDTDNNGIQTNEEISTVTTPGGGKSELCHKEPGIPGVVLYLEDGTRVITDSHGKFSIPGVSPGTHVLRIDTMSLPEGIKLKASSGRSMGDGASQFIDVGYGSLFKANFTARPLNGKGSSAIRTEEPSASQEGVASPTHVLSGVTAKTAQTVTAGESPVQNHTRSVSGHEELRQGENYVSPKQPPLEEQILTMSKELAFVSPADGDTISGDSTRVLIKAPLGSTPALTVNGRIVDSSKIGKTITEEKGRVVLFEFIGVPFDSGTTNMLKVVITDPFGNERGNASITLETVGSAHRILIDADRKSAPADGNSKIQVTATILDNRGNIVPYSTPITVTTGHGKITAEDIDPSKEEIQIPCKNGIAQFTIQAPLESGEAEVYAYADNLEEHIEVFFSPNLRDLFAVGIGEVTIGHGSTRGDFGYLKDGHWFDDGLYGGSRGAFFLKGNVYRDYLLTASFDSEKEEADELFRESDNDIEAEEKYPIYGDESTLGYEALSKDKLYIKVEKNRSFLLYGDYHTKLNDTKLAAYQRSFNGLKYNLNTERFKLSAFGSKADQTQVVDALPGRGISGYYYLTHTPVLSGSERVVIEVRDRARPDRIISRETRSRGSDYDIDYDVGTILFKEPIPIRDSDYNPVFVIISYEAETGGKNYYFYGGRAAFRVLTWLEVGTTGIVEEQAAGDYSLLGGDLTLHLPGKTTFKAEYAETRALFDISNAMVRKSGGGWSLDLESSPVDRLSLTGYYRNLDDYFKNISATDAPRGTEKYGFDGSYALTDQIGLKGTFFDEKDKLNHSSHSYASLGAQARIQKTKIAAELSRETSDDQYIPVTSDSTRSPFDMSEETPRELTAAGITLETELRPNLSLTLGHKRNIKDENLHTSQAGLNYQISEINRLYMREEYQKYSERTETRTLFGVESKVIKNTVAFSEYRLVDGSDSSRNQQAIGVRNKFHLAEKLTGNLSAEYLSTLSGKSKESEPDAFAIATGLEYLPQDDFKITGRFEHRNELSGTGIDSYLGEAGLLFKLNPAYSLLAKERYFYENSGIMGTHTTSRTMVGLAWRPLCDDRFNGLAKMEYKVDDDGTIDPDYKTTAMILSTEGVYQVSSRLQLFGKYAGKLSKDDEYSSYTDLVSARFLYDLTDRIDLGAEYRILTSHKLKSTLQGGNLEVGYRVVKNLWVSLGYSFDDFDADLIGEDYQGKGPYVKLRFKFSEDTIKGLFKKDKK